MIKVGVLAEDLSFDKETQAALKKFVKDLQEQISFFHLKPEDYLSEINTKKNPPDVDVVLTRTGLSDRLDDYKKELNALNNLNKTKIPLVNNPLSAEICASKLRQLSIARASGVQIPESYGINAKNAVNISKKLGFPMVIKNSYGYGGKSVYLVNNEKETLNLIKKNKDQILLAQKYLDLRKKKDYRVVIIDGKAVGGVIREAKTGDFRANVALGGVRKFFRPNKKIAAIALRLYKKLSMDMGSIDFLIYKNKYYFIESNATVGIRDLPVVKALFKLIKKKVDHSKKRPLDKKDQAGII